MGGNKKKGGKETRLEDREGRMGNYNNKKAELHANGKVHSTDVKKTGGKGAYHV